MIIISYLMDLFLAAVWWNIHLKWISFAGVATESHTIRTSEEKKQS